MNSSPPHTLPFSTPLSLSPLSSITLARDVQACKNNKPLLVPMTFMNGYRTLCEVDSASTVQELVNNIAEKIGLLDPTGFSVYVTLHTKV